jgi:hypothetical protein
MRKTLHVQDRVLGRIPYFNVRRTPTAWPSVWVVFLHPVENLHAANQRSVLKLC